MKRDLFLSATLFICAAGEVGANPRPTSLGCPQLRSSAQSQALDYRVEQGDDRAAHCLALGLHSLDGGELEDALVALGVYGDRKPVELLALAHRGVLSKQSLADAVGMLPLSLTDDMQGQFTVMKARRSKFRQVSQPELASEQRAVLKSIESALAEIRPHVSNRKK